MLSQTIRRLVATQANPTVLYRSGQPGHEYLQEKCWRWPQWFWGSRSNFWDLSLRTISLKTSKGKASALSLGVPHSTTFPSRMQMMRCALRIVPVVHLQRVLVAARRARLLIRQMLSRPIWWKKEANAYMVGGFNPSEKYQSVGMIVPNIKNVPNHQPGYVGSGLVTGLYN